MREIKFRIYFNFFEDGYMDFPYCIENGGKTVIYDGDDYEVGEEVKLMQYTGLKDKNGAEIYEGDLVKLLDSIDEEVCVVKYEYGRYLLENREFTEELSNCEDKFLEVVGNIWENKELLEGK